MNDSQAELTEPIFPFINRRLSTGYLPDRVAQLSSEYSELIYQLERPRSLPASRRDAYQRLIQIVGEAIAVTYALAQQINSDGFTLADADAVEGYHEALTAYEKHKKLLENRVEPKHG